MSEEYKSAPGSRGSRRNERSNGNENRIQFRFPEDELWVYKSMATLFFEKGYIPKPTIQGVARLSLSFVARVYLNEGEATTQQFRGLVPLRNYKSIQRELADREARLADANERTRVCEISIKKYEEIIESQKRTNQNLWSALKHAKEKFRELEKYTMDLINKSNSQRNPMGRVPKEVRSNPNSYETKVLQEQPTSVSKDQANSDKG